MKRQELEDRCKAAFDGCVAALTNGLPEDSDELPGFVMIVTKPGSKRIYSVASNLHHTEHVAEAVLMGLMAITTAAQEMVDAEKATRQ